MLQGLGAGVAVSPLGFQSRPSVGGGSSRLHAGVGVVGNKVVVGKADLKEEAVLRGGEEEHVYSLCAGGRFGEAMDVVEQGGMTASRRLCAEMMRGCGERKDLAGARRMHSYVCGRGWEMEGFVGSGIVEMYVKCGSLVDARRVHEELSSCVKKEFCWAALIAGYVKHGRAGEALVLYEEMREEGVEVSGYTFVHVLKACGSLQDLEAGKRVHGHVVESGKESQMFVATTLVDMYVKCGSMVDARHVFDRLPHRDVVSWTAIIMGCANQGKHEVALELYGQMLVEGIAPNDRTFVGVLKACGGLAAMEDGMKECCLAKGRSIHHQVVKGSFDSDVFVGNTLIDMYATCGSTLEARCVFDKLPRCDVVSWTVTIRGHAENKEGEAALKLYAQMQQAGVAPNERTFVGVLKACTCLAMLEEGTEVNGKLLKTSSLEKGRAVHLEVEKRGFESDVYVGTTLVDMYVNCGSMVDAQLIFDKLPHVNVFSWNAMIMGYADQGQSEEAFRLYAQMQQHHRLSPTSVTFVSILKACGNAAALEAGKEVHAEIRRLGLLEMSHDLVLGTSLVDMYGKCGSMVDAQQVFDALPTTNLVTWSALIAGYARQGDIELVFRLLHRMSKEGIQPNAVTFLSLLTVCSHAGLVDKGLQHFHDMREQYGLPPTIQHYNCVVDLLGRAGHIDEAVAMVERMPFKPNFVTWRTLLASCRKWACVEIGRNAFDHVVKMDDKHAAAYVLMSNIYADAHMWEERDEIQAMRQSARAWKKPGQSWWTQVGGQVHTFVVGDVKHPQSEHIAAKLAQLSLKMKVAEYLPEPDCVLWDLPDDDKEDGLCGHSEKLAIACALINTPPGTPIRVVKNLRVCDDCHKAVALISKIEGRQIICRDASRFHLFQDGTCSCGDYW